MKLRRIYLKKTTPEKRRQIVGGGICALAAMGILVIFMLLGVLYNADLRFQDMLFQRPSHEKQPSDIVVIGVDSYALEKNQGQPWDVELYAELIQELNSQEDCRPAAIGLDVLITESSYPDGAQVLAPVLREAGNVVLACSTQYTGRLTVYSTQLSRTAFVNVSDPELILPAQELMDVAQVGHTVPLFDTDGVVRRHMWSLTDQEGGEILSMPYLMYLKYCQVNGLEAEFSPDLKFRNSWVIPFSRLPGGYYVYSAQDILTGAYDPRILKNAMVYVGAYHTAAADEYLSPVDYSHPMNPVECMANISAAMVANKSWQNLPDNRQIAVLAVLCFLLTFYVSITGRLWQGLLAGAVALVGCLTAAIGLCHLGMTTHTLWALEMVALSVGMGALYRGWLWVQERRRVADRLQRYLDPQIVRELTRPGTRFHTSGQVSQVAVLFADIRGFTTMSEKLPADAIIAILNEYLTLTSDCIKRRGGTVDKFIGDSTMALWGAPLECEDSAYAACCAAMDMVEQARLLAAKTQRRYGYQVEFGVGVHFGPAVVGNIGSPERMDYTAVGDTVNTAQRLEAHAPGGKVYISRRVYDLLNGRGQVRSVGSNVRLKGKSGGVEVLELEQLERSGIPDLPKEDVE